MFHYLAVDVVELNYFETCGFLLLRHNVLQTCFRLLCHLVRSCMFDQDYLDEQGRSRFIERRYDVTALGNCFGHQTHLKLQI